MSSRMIDFRMGFVAAVAVAATLTAAADEQTSKKTEVKQRNHAVSFCARSTSASDRSLVGHAFVILSYEDDERQQCVQESLGFFPANGAGVFGKVPGKLVRDAQLNRGKSGTCYLTVSVSEGQLGKVEAIFEKYKTQDYRLADQNCVAFAEEVARSLNLKVPDRSGLNRFPARFIQKLADQR